MLAQVSHGTAKPQKASCDAEKARESLSMSLMSIFSMPLSNFIPLPRMVSHSLSDLFLGLLRASLMGLGDMGREVNVVFSVDSLSLSGELFSIEDVVNLLVGFGEKKFQIVLL